jgi:hypothetical protein
MSLEDRLRELQGRNAPLERLIEVFSASMAAPIFRSNVTDYGFVTTRRIFGIFACSRQRE